VLKQADNQVLTQVGRGTPMGELMRRYWHPVAASAELDDSPFRTKGLKIMGEDLVLFRDRSGQLGLISRYCPHRRVDLAIGVVEQDGLRCQYHGWKFDATGQCVEQPFEDTTHPEDNFRARCAIAGYPTFEIAGLIFAYFGPLPAPAFPLWEPLTWHNVVRDIATIELPCNWLQCQENSLDPVHVEWLHGYFGSYVTTLAGLPDMQVGARSLRHLKIGFDEFEHGIIKRRILEGQTEDDPEWKHGHPVRRQQIFDDPPVPRADRRHAHLPRVAVHLPRRARRPGAPAGARALPQRPPARPERQLDLELRVQPGLHGLDHPGRDRRARQGEAGRERPRHHHVPPDAVRPDQADGRGPAADERL
jgi:nitrite reductase/ring-hydroxylating ferredoxin subunit